MKLFPKSRLLLASALLSVSALVAQTTITDREKAVDLVRKNVATLMLTSDEASNSLISSTYTTPEGITLVYLQQAYKGIPVYNQLQVLAFKEGKLVSQTGSRIGKLSSKVNEPNGVAAITPVQAVQKTAAYLQLKAPASLARLTPAAKNNNDAVLRFAPSGISQQDITVQAMWMPVDENHLKLSWQTFIAPLYSDSMWLVQVDALTGAVLTKTNLTVSCNWDKPASAEAFCNDPLPATQNTTAAADDYGTTAANAVNSANYRVIPFPAESPIHTGGAHAIRTNPWAATTGNATTLGWHNDGTTEWNITRGNNVHTHLDRSATNTNDGAADTSSTAFPDLNFVQAPDYTQSSGFEANRRFATTNLFYFNNVIHDISYLYGFNEVAGNFQATNLGRGGEGNDYVQADVQDGSGYDNANFGTPPDGSSPRMQMYLWKYKSQVSVSVPNENTRIFEAGERVIPAYGGLAGNGPLTGTVAYYNDDATGTNHFACTANAQASSFAGKIALVVRGNCDFDFKIRNAQNAGAIAVIIVNNLDGASNGVGGADKTLTIPTVMISYTPGLYLMEQLNAGKTVTATLSSTGTDCSLDNGIIAHEYTHGISNRLTGGPALATCLRNAEQMGEGWSDYFALMTTTDWAATTGTDGPKPRTIGTYSLNQPTSGAGIRRYPYTTNMSVNPWTYAMLPSTNGQVHTVGEIWCSMLWDMTWNIIETDGINRNLYNATGAGGNSVALKLVMEGMKLQPCSPGFVDGRNAILKADTLYFNGRYSCAIWAAFARRGLGTNALQRSSASYTDGTAGFASPTDAFNNYTFTHDKNGAVSGYETITYSSALTASACVDVQNFYTLDTLPANVTWLSGGSYNASTRVVTFSPLNVAAGATRNEVLKVGVNANAYYPPIIYVNEPVASTAPSGWLQTTTNASYNWSVSNAQSRSAPSSFFAPNAPLTTTVTLTSDKAYSITGTTFLTFWHSFDLESFYDGGLVEISTDNGNTWIDGQPYIIAGRYNGTISTTNTTSAIAGRAAFTGNSGGFVRTTLSLVSFAGKSVMFRWRLVTDETVNATGWYIDDIVLENTPVIINKSQLYNASNSLLSTWQWTISVSPILLPVTWGNFSVQKQGNAALLLWSTLQETNTSSFVIERSSDGINFSPIATVAAAGNSTTRQEYTTQDALPLKGINYYRILQKDKDGKSVYTEVRILSFDGLPVSVTVSPNPAKNKIAITLPGNTEKLPAQIVSASGQVVHSFTISGQYSQQMLPVLAPGVYYLKCTSPSQTVVKKLVIE